MSAIVLNKKPAKDELNKNDKKILYLSVSKIKTFTDCKAKFKFSYIEKLPKKDRDYLTFGKFLHLTLENFYKAFINGSENTLNLEMGNAFKKAYESYKDSITEKQFKEAREIVTNYLNTITHQMSQDILPDVLETEQEFYINIDDKVLLNGFIDRVQVDADGIFHVADYKTSKAKSIKYLKKDKFQLLTYAYVLFLTHPEIKKIRASYILLRARNCTDCGYILKEEDGAECPQCNNKKFHIQYITEELDRDEVMKIEEDFLEYAALINVEEAYKPNPNPLCNWCDFIENCPEGGKFISNMNINNNSKKPQIGAISWDNL